MSVPMRWSDYQIPEEVLYTPLKQEKVLRTRARSRRRSILAVWKIVIASVICFLAAIGTASLVTSFRSGSAQSMQIEIDQDSKIKCEAVKLVRKFNYVTLTGDALNTERHSLENVEVVVQLQDVSHHTLQMAHALVASATLHAGRSTPFQIDIPDDPQAVQCRIWFRKLTGADIS